MVVNIHETSYDSNDKINVLQVTMAFWIGSKKGELFFQV